MATARRFYFYGLCFVSGIMVFAGALILADALLDGGATFDTQNVAQSIAMILVGLPVYAVHWWLAERSVRAGTDERNAALRKAYFYGMLAVSTAAGLIALHSVLSHLVGASANISLASAIAILVIAVATWAYHLRLVHSDSRLQEESGLAATVRRWYQYGLAAVGLAMLAIAASVLLFNLLLIVQGVDDPDRREPLPQLFAALLTSLVAWAPTWYVLQRRAGADGGERRSILRKCYQFLAVIFGAALALFNLQKWLQALSWSLLGLAGTSSSGNPAGFASLVPIGAAVWLYHNATLNADERFAPMPGAAMVRRLLRYALSAIGVALAAFAARDLLAIGIMVAAGSSFAPWREQFGSQLASLLTGLVAWFPAWRVLQSRLATDQDDQRSLLRKLYLYTAAFAGAVTALFNLAAWFQSLLLALFSNRLPERGALVEGTAFAFASAVLGALVWAYHRRRIARDRAFGERPLQASIRRLYDYLFAAISIAVLLAGVALTGETLLQLLLGWITDPWKGDRWWQDRLAWGIASLAAGFPVWTLVWIRTQAAVNAEGDSGTAERRAVSRRFYLYGVALAGAIFVLANLASAIYQIIQAWISPASEVLPGNILAAVFRAIVVGIAWGYHLAVIRRESVRVAALGPSPAIAVAAGPFAEAFRLELARILPAARLVIADTPEGWRGADVAIVPASLFPLGGTQADAIREGAARLLIVPDGDARVRVLNAPSSPSPAEMARQAAYWLEREFTKS